MSSPENTVATCSTCCNTGECFPFWLQPLTEGPWTFRNCGQKLPLGVPYTHHMTLLVAQHKKVVEESRKIGCENPWKSSLGWNLYSIPPGLTGFLFLLRLHWALNFPPKNNKNRQLCRKTFRPMKSPIYCWSRSAQGLKGGHPNSWDMEDARIAIAHMRLTFLKPWYQEINA